MNRKYLGVLISVLMVITIFPSLSFSTTFSSTELPFTDVTRDAWYYSDVKGAYDTGLINGFEDDTFRPDDSMTYAQAVKLAACMNQKYDIGSVTLTNGDTNWWDNYVAYAREKGIINKDYDWNSNATRAGYAEIFAKALPDEALKEKNRIDDWMIPDVDIAHPQSAEIYKLYRAGILTGMDEKGTFQPNSNIKRSEVSAILTRMMNENERKDVTLKRNTEPEHSVKSETITDSWEQIVASVNDGSYKSKYRIGDVKELDLGSEGIVEMQIAAFDADKLADGSGKAAITWISKQLLKSNHRMNPSAVHSDPLEPSVVQTGTGNVGGWEFSEMRAWLKKDVKPLIPSTVKNAIKPVTKYSTSIDTSGSVVNNTSSTEDVWIPSVREVFGPTPYYESEEPYYADLFVSNTDRIKQKNGSSDSSVWWLRSASYIGSLASNGFIDVGTDGNGKFLTDFTPVDSPEGVALGFCM